MNTNTINFKSLAKKDELYVKAFYIANGRTMPVEDNEEARTLLLILEDVSGVKVNLEDFFKRLYRYEDGEEHTHHIKYLCTNVVQGFRQICAVCEVDGEEPLPQNLDDEYGIFSFVYNVDCPTDSEFGYCFFEKASPTYRRVG